MALQMTRMRARRLELGLSQRDVASRARVANSDLSRFETRMGTPYKDQAARIARVLDLPAESLVEVIQLEEAAAS
jgi:transcriptional regulator with XRE-family HTH domain